MCGIVGVVSFESTGISDFTVGMFSQMLYANALRGMHGTGAFGVQSTGSWRRIRVGGPPHQLFGDREFDDFQKWIKKRSTAFLVGHNRLATRGARTTQNSHPFVHGNTGERIILVHNGTLDSYYHLAKDAKKFDVDSEALCAGIAEKGIDATIKHLRGAWTVVYYDEKQGTLNILRNEKRPLFMLKNDFWKYLMIGSEKEMLEWIVRRNQPSTNFQVTEVPVDKLLTFDIGAEKPKVKEMKGEGALEHIVESDCGDCSVYPGAFTSDTVASRQKIEEQIVTKETKKVSAESSTSVIPFRDYEAATSPAATSTKRGPIPAILSAPKKQKDAGGDGGHRVRVDFLHSLSRDGTVVVQFDNYNTIHGGKEFFEIKCSNDEYPDVQFILRLKGEQKLLGLLEAAEGIRAKIISIMKSQQNLTEFPHLVFLGEPEPASSVVLTKN